MRFVRVLHPSFVRNGAPAPGRGPNKDATFRHSSRLDGRVRRQKGTAVMKIVFHAVFFLLSLFVFVPMVASGCSLADETRQSSIPSNTVSPPINGYVAERRVTYFPNGTFVEYAPYATSRTYYFGNGFRRNYGWHSGTRHPVGKHSNGNHHRDRTGKKAVVIKK